MKDVLIYEQITLHFVFTGAHNKQFIKKKIEALCQTVKNFLQINYVCQAVYFIMNLYEKMSLSLTKLRNDRMLRTSAGKAQNGAEIEIDGRKLVNLSSNDYLGFAQDKELQAEFLSSLPEDAARFSSSGSPLLTGAHPAYARALATIEELSGRRALFFNTGFGANSGIIAALCDGDTLVLADKLSHASIIDGMGAGRGKALRFAHNSLPHLRQLLNRYAADFKYVLLITEAVFSMDGDKAPLRELVALKKDYPNLYLYVDEAHSFALYGEKGLGLCSLEQIFSDVDFILCTCGKGLGSQGAFVLCNETARDYLINTVRPLIFSTAMPPCAFAHIDFMLRKMVNGESRRQRLQKISGAVRSCLEECGADNLSDSQIIPLLTFDNERAVQAFDFFRERGFYAMPIRHPTVPRGKARLRLSLTASLSDQQVCHLCEVIRQFLRKAS